jgi:hypothetical protein
MGAWALCRADQRSGHLRDAELRPRWQEIKNHLVPERNTRRGPVISGSFAYNGPGAIEPLGAEPELKRRFLGFTVTLYRDGKQAETLGGTLLKFSLPRRPFFGHL